MELVPKQPESPNAMSYMIIIT